MTMSWWNARMNVMNDVRVCLGKDDDIKNHLVKRWFFCSLNK